MKTKNLKYSLAFSLTAIIFILPNFALATVATPINFSGAAQNGKVTLQWTDSSTAIDHLVEYKPASDSTWSVYPHAISAASGISVGNLTNGISYDFRVSTIAATEMSATTAPLTLTPTTVLQNDVNNHILTTGQSNALGPFMPALSVTQPFSNRMLSLGSGSLVPLVEPITGGIAGITGETISSGMANSITELIGGSFDYPSIITLSAGAGLVYTDLMQGTSYYNNLLTFVGAAKYLSNVEGKPLIVRMVTVIHGENDESSGTTPAEYESYLLEWQNDYETDIRAITGQSEEVPMFINQMNSWNSMGSATPEIAIGQYNAAKNHPDKIILVTPNYILDAYDNLTHMTNYSYRRLGEYYAKVYKKVVIDGEQWQPLMPEEINIYGNIIHARFHVPVPPLAFDTTGVMAKANYGFEYADSTNSASITNVAIISPDTVAITLSNIPTGSNPKLRYAYTGVVGTNMGSHTYGAPGGNLRDSDTTLAPHQDSSVPTYMGNYLRNWAVTFEEAINVMPSTPSAPMSVTASLVPNTNGTALVSFTLPSGSSPATSYAVTSAPGNIVATGTESPILVGGLSNNTTYTFTVVAENGTNQSTPSLPSNPVTPHWIAAKPQIVGALQKPRIPVTVKPQVKSRNSGMPISNETLKASVAESAQLTKETPEVEIEKVSR